MTDLAFQQLVYWAVDLVFKSSLILTAAWAITGLSFRASAAFRHRIWAAAFVAVLLLPALTWVSPKTSFAILPAGWGWEASGETSEMDGVANDYPGFGPVTLEQVQLLNPVADGGVSKPVERSQTASSSQALQPSKEQFFWIGDLDVSRILAITWIAGFVVLNLNLFRGLISRSVADRTRNTFSNDSIEQAYAVATTQLKIRSKVQVVEGKAGGVPMTWGVVTPRIQLPSNSVSWSHQKILFTLLHELSHVKRNDVLVQLCARLATSIYWFNPLCWIGLRMLRIERELACDDCVLEANSDAAGYADTLVSIARSCSMQTCGLAVAMARPSELRIRIQAMLDVRRNRRPLGATKSQMILWGTGAMLCLLASTQFGTAQTEPELRLVSDSRAGDELSFKLVDISGKPIRNAKIYGQKWLGVRSDTRLLAASDSEGFCMVDPKRLDEVATLCIKVEGALCLVSGDENGSVQGKIEAGKIVVDAPPEEVLRGRILNPEGQPVSGATVRVSLISSPRENSGSFDDWESAAIEKGAEFYELRNRFKLVSTMLRTDFDSLGFSPVLTDGNGVFEIPGIGSGRIVQLQLAGPGIEGSEIKVRTRGGDDIRFERGSLSQVCYANDFTFVAGAGGAVSGIVRDIESGKPLAGLTIAAGSFSSRFGIGQSWIKTTTNTEGYYELEGFKLEPNQMVVVQPELGSEYLPAGDRLQFSNSNRKLETDFKLSKGEILEGQAIHENTGKPLQGYVHFYVPFVNKALQQIPGFRRSMVDLEVVTDKEGRFQLTVPRGKGIVGFTPMNRHNFLSGVGADAIDFPHSEDRGIKIFNAAPMPLIATNECNLKEVEIKEGEVNRVEFSLTSGVEVECLIVDENDRPAAGCLVSLGEHPTFWRTFEKANLKTAGVFPGTVRELFAYDSKRNLAGHATLSGPDAKPVIRLQPAGSVRGRLMGSDYQPLRNKIMQGEGLPIITRELGKGMAPIHAITTDSEGMFKIDGLIVGRRYKLLDGSSKELIAELVVDQAGTTKDFGDIRVN